jgi:putative nucleotidyltransferase with HDIG domain
MLAPFGLASYFREAAGGQSRLVLTKLAALLHDVGKPQTKTREADGRVRFLGHSEAGAQLGRAVCRRLRLGNKETHFVTRLIEEHLRPAQLSQSGAPTDRAVFRFFRDLGEAAPACLVLSLADAAAAAGPRLTLARWRAQLAYIAYVFARAAAQEHAAAGAGRRGKRHFVSGDRLIRALEIAPGPEVGRLLDALDEAAATGEVKSEEEAIELARRLYENRPPGERAGRAGTA